MTSTQTSKYTCRKCYAPMEISREDHTFIECTKCTHRQDLSLDELAFPIKKLTPMYSVCHDDDGYLLAVSEKELIFCIDGGISHAELGAKVDELFISYYKMKKELGVVE